MRIAACLVLLLFLLPLPASAGELQIEHDGTTLNANLAGAEAGAEAVSDTDRLLLMVHGTRGHFGMDLLRNIQEGLAKRGIASLAINLSLGVDDRHGIRKCEPAHDYTNAEALAEMGAWIGWAKEQGVERLALLGHSRGGNQVARYLAEEPAEAVRGAVLLAPATWDEESVAAAFEQRFDTPLEKPLSRAQAMAEEGYQDAWMNHVPFLYCPDARVKVASFLSYYGGDEALDTPSILPDAKRPVKLMVGTEDENVPDLAERTETLPGNADVTRRVLEGAGHFFEGEYTEQVVVQTGEFLYRIGW
ncbi:alpha/beta hydrolase [Thiohalorhabdus denitrificans]|uniref:Pimeloyl-ACP methyl ester carboxylesterase n=1 Tax=Thiohalorhabdus denitrificans TaxID=381306 RepID=A0A1G5AME8_9GAMM|nr:alpha/beta fold hydrolase [Thiohalorhabdus denitrificans]SCX79032.1 Pimeloyl-ACP methyl ester carboxylesterase [Thiohalorhabdus denitrificans]